MLFYPQKSDAWVGYKIRYEHSCSEKVPPPDVILKTETPDGKNALKIMEEAHEKYGKAYEYTVEENLTYGAFITELNGTAAVKPCYWAVLIQSADGSEKMSPVGVSSLTIKNKETLVMKYQH